ncbi:MAG: 16S rRNA (cytosine(967)-C(5))-methyltransferase RsmB [Acidobacteria bacterium]|nr:16S rRNA (cytosine(967)-C(5))-methyltransferase RsmB [Acidobacteriota bacterium]
MNKTARLIRRPKPQINNDEPTQPTTPPPDVAPARRAAFDVLMRVGNEDAYASNLLASEQYNSLSREDHGLLNELVLGVLRWQRSLDLLIERYAQRPVNQLDPEVVLALRLALYQVRFLSRIPAHAALNESVNLVKLHAKDYAASFVNGVLRSATRDAETPMSEIYARVPNELARAGFALSHPSWLLKRWQARLGEPVTYKLAQTNNTPPRIAFRFNETQAPVEQTSKWLAQQGIETRTSIIAPQAQVITSGSLSGQADPLKNGALYVQDEASQLVAHLTVHSIRNPKAEIASPRILDLCAAPGSKALMMAALAPDADIFANDLYAHRLRTLDELRERLGIVNILSQQNDATGELPAKWQARFDAVLLDAPCSGLGTLQRHPEIKWRITESKLKELSELQSTLLANALRCVKPEGTLVYSVCSTELEEGEEVIAKLLAENPNWRDITAERLTALGLNAQNFLTEGHGARTWPHQHDCEGFYFCVLQQQQNTDNA